MVSVCFVKFYDLLKKSFIDCPLGTLEIMIGSIEIKISCLFSGVLHFAPRLESLN